MSATNLRPSPLEGFVQTPTGLTVPTTQQPTTPIQGDGLNYSRIAEVLGGTIRGETAAPQFGVPPVLLTEPKDPDEKPAEKPGDPPEKRGRVLGYFNGPAVSGWHSGMQVTLTEARTVAAVKKILESCDPGKYTIFEVVATAEVAEEIVKRKVCR